MAFSDRRGGDELFGVPLVIFFVGWHGLAGGGFMTCGGSVPVRLRVGRGWPDVGHYSFRLGHLAAEALVCGIEGFCHMYLFLYFLW